MKQFLSRYQLLSSMHGQAAGCYKPATLVVIFHCCFLLSITAQLIVRTDFNRERVWHKDYRPKEKWIDVSAEKSDTAIKAMVTWGKWGTVDVANTVTPSEALALNIDNAPAAKSWEASINSGLLPAVNRESHLGKLTLSFDHWVSSLRPITVTVTSYDVNKIRTGSLEKTVYPAAAKFFLRTAMELADMKASGSGNFDPTAPFVHFSFAIGNAPATGATDGKHELRIDNVAYASPAWYVSPAGNDKNNGRTEKTAFANPQKALDMSKPGDIILLMNGQYSGAKNTNADAVASFMHPGYPSAWITLKNYPGHQPTILAHGRHGVNIALGNDSTFHASPLLSYIEVRGLHIRGNADEAEKLFPDELGTFTKNTQVNGINLVGANGPTRMYHHFRIADNIVEYCGGYGVFTHTVDYLFVENNILRNNCYTTVDLCSAGFACMMYADFDKVDNVTKILVRNNQAYGNQVKVRKKVGGPKVFNGDGFLFDANCEDYIAPDFYLGRTLIQNNLVYGNGGGGIQMWGSHRLDVVNNTIYHNGLTPELRWGNLGFDFCKDVTVINNIIVALPDRPLDRWLTHQADRKTAGIVRINNLYHGGMMPNIPGMGDIVADPLFVNPSLDPAVADFRLKSGSRAISAGYTQLEGLPVIDVTGNTRLTTEARVDLGAYKFN